MEWVLNSIIILLYGVSILCSFKNPCLFSRVIKLTLLYTSYYFKVIMYLKLMLLHGVPYRWTQSSCWIARLFFFLNKEFPFVYYSATLERHCWNPSTLVTLQQCCLWSFLAISTTMYMLSCFGLKTKVLLELYWAYG